EVRDAVRAPPRTAQHRGRDERRATLHRLPRRLGRLERAGLVGPRGDALDRPARLQINDDRLLEPPALVHEVPREIEDRVVSGELVVAAEAVTLAVLVEP